MIGPLLEREIARTEADGGDTGPMAQRLALNYAIRLRSLDQAGRDALEGRLAKLLKAYPDADTRDLQVARLEDQFHQGELLALRWIDEPSDGVREAALEILGRATPDLRRHRDELLDRVARGNEQLDRLGGKANRRAELERRVLHESEVAGRATYYTGWAALYANWLGPAGVDGLAGFREARLCFKRLLGLEEDDLVNDPFDLRLDNASQARVLLGLGLADLAIGNLDAGRDAFRVLRNGQTHPSVRDWLDFWEVAGLRRAGRTADARQLAERAVQALPRQATPGRAALCKLLIRAGADTPELGPIGLHGLVRMNQFDLARGLLRSNPVPPESVGGMLGLWVQGLERLNRAEINRDPTDYEAAAERFRKAAEHPEAGANRPLSAVCLYALGCCQLRLDQAGEASETLRKAVEAMKADGLAEVVDAEWMAAQAGYRLARTDQEKAEAGQAFARFAERYPKHPNAAVVPGILGRIADLSPRPATESGPVTIESCRRLYERWKDLAPARRRTSPETRALATALERADRADLPGPDRLELDVIRADLALSGDPGGLDSARRVIERVVSLGTSLPDGSPMRTAQAEVRLKWAQLVGGEEQLRKAAEDLAERAKGVPSEVEARSVLASLADQALQRSPSDAVKRADAREAYRKLLALLERDGPFDRGKPGRAAAGVSLRLAELDAAEGDGEAAQKRVVTLLAAYPNDAGLLERSARVLAESGRFDRALETYRTLLNGLEDGSEAWYSATIGRIECLERIDRERAREAFSRFRTLHPESSWPDRRKADLERLAARLH